MVTGPAIIWYWITNIPDLHLRVSGGIDYNQQNMNQFSPSTLDKYYHWSTSMKVILDVASPFEREFIELLF